MSNDQVNFATMVEMMRDSAMLASDPKARDEAEAAVRKNLPDGFSFWIDGSGIGHLGDEICVSSVNLSEANR